MPSAKKAPPTVAELRREVVEAPRMARVDVEDQADEIVEAEAGDGDGDGDGDEKDTRGVVDRVLDVLEASPGFELAIDELDEPHILSSDARGPTATPVFGRDGEDIIRSAYMIETQGDGRRGRIISSKICGEVVDNLGFMARSPDGHSFSVRKDVKIATRSAALGWETSSPRIMVDGPDGRVLGITRDGFQWLNADAAARDGVRFVRGKGYRPLRLSDEFLKKSRAMDALLLFDHLPNVPLKSRPVLLMWGISTLLNSTAASLPILMVNAQEDSGKSTLNWLLGETFDTGTKTKLDLTGRRDLMPHASAWTTTIFDNLSAVSVENSNFLCKLATGDEVSERQMRTNFGEVSRRARSSVVISGIPNLADRPDLASRTLPVRLNKIRRDTRRGDIGFRDRYLSALPKILAGIMRMVQGALYWLPEARRLVKERGSDCRMIEAQILFVACELALTHEWAEGIRPGRAPGSHANDGFDRDGSGIWEPLSTLQETERLRKGMRRDVVEAEEVGRLLARFALEWFDGHGQDPSKPFRGNATELRKHLEDQIPAGVSTTLPKGARGLGRKLAELQSAMTDVGVELDLGLTDKHRRKTVTVVDADTLRDFVDRAED